MSIRHRQGAFSRINAVLDEDRAPRQLTADSIGSVRRAGAIVPTLIFCAVYCSAASVRGASA